MGHLIQSRLNQGEQIILIADFNKDVTTNKMKQWAESIGLEEILSSKLGKISTRQRGSAPIDSIYVSSTINVSSAGYTAFEVFDSDHRCLWIKVPTPISTA